MRTIVRTFLALCLAILAIPALAKTVGEFFLSQATQSTVRHAAAEWGRMMTNKDTKARDQEDAIKTYDLQLTAWSVMVNSIFGPIPTGDARFKSETMKMDGFMQMTCARHRGWCPHGSHEVNHALTNRLLSWRNLFIEDARAYMKNPANLWTTYLTNKQSIVDGLKDASSTNEARIYLKSIEKYFPASKETADFMRLNISQLKKDLGVGHDWYAYEFSERRRHEGGDALVQMWGNVIRDLSASL